MGSWIFMLIVNLLIPVTMICALRQPEIMSFNEK